MRRSHLFPAAVMVMLAACGSSGPDDGTASTSSPPIPITDAVPTTTIVVAGAVSTTPVIQSESASEDDEPGEVLRSGSRLDAGVRYSVPDFYPGLGLSFENPINGAVADLSSVLYVATDGSFGEGLLAVANVDGAGVYADPFVDLASIASMRQTIDAMAGRMPDDFLGWFTTLPGITFGPIEATEVDGLPARRVSYDAADLPEGAPSCGGTPCLAAYQEGTFSGNAYVVLEGERGTAYEVRVNGVRLHIDVPDRPEARSAFESLRLAPAPFATTGEVLPQWGPVSAGTAYVARTEAGLEYTVGPLASATSVARDRSSTSFASPALLFPGTGDAALIDPAVLEIRDDPTRRPIEFGGDGDPGPTQRPTDVLAAIAAHPAVEVVKPEEQVTIPGATARAIEVTAKAGEWAFPCGDTGDLCAWLLQPDSLFLTTGRTTRIVVVESLDGATLLVALAHLGTPGEDLVGSIAVTVVPD